MEVFFYGLFMDENILLKNGVEPRNPRVGYLQDYTLKIGERASLLRSEGEQAYGIVMSVDEKAIQRLYAEPSVADYIPEEVEVALRSGETIKAIGYKLPVELITGTNTSYAKQLYDLASVRGFPLEYLEKIKSCIRTEKGRE